MGGWKDGWKRHGRKREKGLQGNEREAKTQMMDRSIGWMAG